MGGGPVQGRLQASSRVTGQPRFELQGCLFEQVPPSSPTALGGALIIVQLYFYVLPLKEAPPSKKLYKHQTSWQNQLDIAEEERRPCLRWLAHKFNGSQPPWGLLPGGSTF